MDDSLNYAFKAVCLDPDNLKYLVFLGVVYFRRQRWQSSIDIFKKAIKKAQNSAQNLIADLYYMMGILFEKQGKES